MDGLIVKKLEGDSSGKGNHVTTLSKPVMSLSFAEQYMGGGAFGKEEKREEVGGGARTVAAESRDWRGRPGSGAALKAAEAGAWLSVSTGDHRGTNAHVKGSEGAG